MRIRAVAMVIVLLALGGCKDDPPIGPTTQDLSQARKDLVAKLKKDKGKAAEPVAKPKRNAKADAASLESSFAAIGEFTYDSQGKRDPFRSFEWDQMKVELLSESARGPLEQFDVSQLAIVGVIWDANRSRALVQDPSGMSYVVGEGARIGKNEGRVIRIDDNLVVVKETYVDFMGEETTKDIEMRIRGTEGG